MLVAEPHELQLPSFIYVLHIVKFTKYISFTGRLSSHVIQHFVSLKNH